MAITSFNADSTSEQVLAALSKHIAGKNVIINGASHNSMGAEVARVIAPFANLVILGGRNPAKIKATIDTIKTETPEANLRSFTFDMSSLAGARKAAEEVNAMSESIHVLINSAAIMAAPWSKTVDGIEHHLAVNHITPFLFTSLIFPKLKAAGTPSDPARIIGISTAAHFYSGLQEDVNFWNGAWYQKWTAYGQSKTAVILYGSELARRAKESGVHVVAFSVHPGIVASTNIGAYLTAEDFKHFAADDGRPKLPIKKLEQGVAGYLVGAFDPSLIPHSGAYIANCDVSEFRAKHSRSQADAERLWEISESLTGQQFVI